VDELKLSSAGATDVSHASWGSSVQCDLHPGTDEPDGTSVAPDVPVPGPYFRRFDGKPPGIDSGTGRFTS
jgi:hypothetical protein